MKVYDMTFIQLIAEGSHIELDAELCVSSYQMNLEPLKTHNTVLLLSQILFHRKHCQHCVILSLVGCTASPVKTPLPPAPHVTGGLEFPQFAHSLGCLRQAKECDEALQEKLEESSGTLEAHF